MLMINSIATTTKRRGFLKYSTHQKKEEEKIKKSGLAGNYLRKQK